MPQSRMKYRKACPAGPSRSLCRALYDSWPSGSLGSDLRAGGRNGLNDRKRRSSCLTNTRMSELRLMKVSGSSADRGCGPTSSSTTMTVLTCGWRRRGLRASTASWSSSIGQPPSRTIHEPHGADAMWEPRLLRSQRLATMPRAERFCASRPAQTLSFEPTHTAGRSGSCASWWDAISLLVRARCSGTVFRCAWESNGLRSVYERRRGLPAENSSSSRRFLTSKRRLREPWQRWDQSWSRCHQ